MVSWRQFSIKRHFCSVCNAVRPMVRLDNNEISARCTVCRSTSITLSLVAALNEIRPNFTNLSCYELSARGPLLNYLNKHGSDVRCSEYYQQITPGGYFQGVQCQDVQSLTYANQSFDLCTSTEVFEHVPDDHRGFAEICRVLKPGGVFVFTVPLHEMDKTVERARLIEPGKLEHLLVPEYHLDPIRGHEPILVYRNYGQDIVSRLLAAGFAHAEIKPIKSTPWAFITPVVIAYRDEGDI